VYKLNTFGQFFGLKVTGSSYMPVIKIFNYLPVDKLCTL